MPKFRKRPVEIEAVQLGALGLIGLPPIQGAMVKADEYPQWFMAEIGQSLLRGERQLFVQTLEGTMAAEPGDWIIKGVKGELYPCKPDIFDVSYEPVE